METEQLQALKKLADDAKDWILSLRDVWQRNPGTWEVGYADDEGNKYEVLVIDCAAYDRGPDSEKLARFYAAANPAAVLDLLGTIEAQKIAIDALTEQNSHNQRTFADLRRRAPAIVDIAKEGLLPGPGRPVLVKVHGEWQNVAYYALHSYGEDLRWYCYCISEDDPWQLIADKIDWPTHFMHLPQEPLPESTPAPALQESKNGN